MTMPAKKLSDHAIYVELQTLIGTEATLILAQRFGGGHLYFPRVGDGSRSLASCLTNEKKPPITSTENKRRRAVRLGKGFRYGEVRRLVVEMRLQFATYEEIAQAVKDAWPDKPEKHVSKSAVARFWNRLLNGELKGLGLNSPLKMSDFPKV